MKNARQADVSLSWGCYSYSILCLAKIAMGIQIKELADRPTSCVAV